MKLFKNNHFVKIIFSVIIFLFLFYFLDKMFVQTIKEGFYGSCPQSQYLNQEFNKCCAMEKWYSPTKNTCLAQQQGACPKGQYNNDRYKECCDKDKYWHNGAKKCVVMK